MKKVYQHIFFAWILCCISFTLSAQVRFEIKPAVKEIGKEDVIEVAYEVNAIANSNDFIEPVFKQWKVISGPAFSSQSVITNGKASSTTSFVYTLKPLTTGNLSLPVAGIMVNAKQLGCSTVNILVRNVEHVQGKTSSNLQLPGGILQQDFFEEDQADANSLLLPGENALEKMKNNIFVAVDASSYNCFVGEPVLVTYKLYTRLHSNSKPIQQPAFNGCTVYEMTTDNIFPELEKKNGKDYRTYVIRKVQLIPLRTGDIVLDSASVENEITFYRNQNNVKNIPETHTITLSNKPAVIHVKPLPVYKNDSLQETTAIGNFTIATHVSKTKDTAGENNTLYITIEGQGNFQNISCPHIQWPQHIDHFETSERSDINKLVFPSSGNTTFEIPFVLQQAGKFSIPPINFTYFDIITHQYKTIHSDSIAIDAAPAFKTHFDTSKLSEAVNNKKYVWLIGLIAAIAAVSLWWMNASKKEKQLAALKKSTPIEPVAEVIDASIEVKQQHASFINNTAVLFQQLKAKENSREFYHTCKELLRQIERGNISEDVQQRCIVLREACDEALYAPSSAANRKEMIDAIEELLLQA